MPVCIFQLTLSCEEKEISDKRPYVAITCSTCGPERLLSILRHCDDYFTESLKENIVIRMLNETPPFGGFKMDASRNQGDAKKLIQDLSSLIRILVVDGNFRYVKS